MKKSLMASAAAAALTLATALPALANCADEIAALKSQHFTGSISSDATQTVAPKATDQAATGGAAAANTATAGQVPGTEATAAMNAVVGDRAASPADVKAQDAGEQTAAEQAQTGEAPQEKQAADAGDAASQSKEDQFAILLKRAEEYQGLGNEQACMNVIEEMKAFQ